MRQFTLTPVGGAVRRRGLAVLPLLLSLAGSCDRIPERARPAQDGMTPSMAEGAIADSIAMPGPSREDTLVGMGMPAATDTLAVIPEGDELVVLAAELVVPVAGVGVEEIADTFLEPRGSRIHHAIDIHAPRGTPVLSAAGGRVLKLFTSVAGGLMVYAADPTERFVLLYSHLDAYAPGLEEGMPLRPGQPIGTVGTTGNAPPDTPHLHFGIARSSDVSQWWTGTPIDPLPLLRRR